MLTLRAPSLWGHLERLHDEMTRRALGMAWSTPSGPAFAPSYPPVNIWQDDDAVYAEAELPGVRPDHVEVFVTNGNELTIQGERLPGEAPQGAWLHRERGFGKFCRVLLLPAPVEADKVEAHFEQGVLHLTLPKVEQARPRRIPVRGEALPALEQKGETA